MVTAFRLRFRGSLLQSLVGALLILACASAFQIPTTTTTRRCSLITTTTQSKTLVYSSSKNDASSDMDNSEETLLRLRLAVQDGVSPQDALASVQSYTQSFPFAVILPVQPMQYLPTHDGGVDVLFLRKKTQQKGSVDGGMRFYITSDKDDDDDDDDAIEVLVKRNSNGQVVSKMFSEKLIVQAIVKAFGGEKDERIKPAPLDAVSVESVFHKWLDNQVADKQ